MFSWMYMQVNDTRNMSTYLKKRKNLLFVGDRAYVRIIDGVNIIDKICVLCCVSVPKNARYLSNDTLNFIRTYKIELEIVYNMI